MSSTLPSRRLTFTALLAALALLASACNLGARGPGDPIEDPTGPQVEDTVTP